MMSPMADSDDEALQKLEKLRVGAHAMLTAVVDGAGADALIEALRSKGLLGENDVQEWPVVVAAHFLVHILFEAQAAMPPGRDALALLLKYQIDKQYLPGGDAPSLN
jgi:hypothetical protein